MTIINEAKVEESLEILNGAVERSMNVLMATLSGKLMDKDEEILFLSDTIEKSRRCLYQALGKE